MAALESRQVVAWTIPTLALVVSLLWLRRRYRSRDPPTSDPGGFSLVKRFTSTPYRRRPSLADCTLSPVACTSFQGLTQEEAPAPEELHTQEDCETPPSLKEEAVEAEPEHVLVTLENEPAVAAKKSSDSESIVKSESVQKEQVEVPSSDRGVLLEERPISEVECCVEERKELEIPMVESCEAVNCETKVEELHLEAKPQPMLEVQNPEVDQKDKEPVEVEGTVGEGATATPTEIEGTETDKKEELSCDIVEIETKPEVTTMEKGVLEEKLASLVLDTMKINDSGIKQNSERDSANQSPSEVMLASPSISNFSDAHSEGSSDSGKGHSDVATSPSRTPAGGSSLAGDSAFSVYEFVLPQVMVGRLIGRHGGFIHEIRSSTNTNIFIKRHPDTSKLKICAIEGTQQDIDKALAKIRQKFPLRRYPKLTLEKVSFISLHNPPPLKPEDFYLQLVEGVNNDVILSSLISAAHFFLQQPSHPTYTALSRLNQVMNTVYSNSDAPVVETPVKDAICAAPTMGGWYRAQIVEVDEENQKCDVRFVDYGGYLTLETSALRQIRGDLLMLPFQAVECYLANVVPAGDEEEWSEEARLVVQSLTHGQLLQAQIYDYAEDGTPLVYLYSTLESQIILINEELVARGFAAIATSSEE